MPLTSSGQIDLNAMHVEAGGTSGTECTMNDTDIRGLISKDAASQMSFSEWYGASNTFSFTISSNTQEANLSTLATAAGWNGTSDLACTIGSGVYVWSDSTSTPALLINVAGATVTNSGYIIGRGGNGGWRGNGYAGGVAINITAASTTIVNNSGAYIAGGGGSGGGSTRGTNTAGGGGGAGGGQGGQNKSQGHSLAWSLAGGSVGNTGPIQNHTDGVTGNAVFTAGGAGGAGGFAKYDQAQTGGCSGGRQLPGSGGGRASVSYTYDVRDDGNRVMYGNGDGGSANNSGSNGTFSASAGGGGGWGASGGSGDGKSGGSGGAAISGLSRTLTNNGTVYGST